MALKPGVLTAREKRVLASVPSPERARLGNPDGVGCGERWE